MLLDYCIWLLGWKRGGKKSELIWKLEYITVIMIFRTCKIFVTLEEKQGKKTKEVSQVFERVKETKDTENSVGASLKGQFPVFLPVSSETSPAPGQLRLTTSQQERAVTVILPLLSHPRKHPQTQSESNVK